MRSNRSSRPRQTHRYQAQRQRHIWVAPLPWDSFCGTCTAVAKNPDDSFSVLVESRGKSLWLPAERVPSGREVVEWLRRCCNPQ